MSDTTVSLLTPPGAGAIATVEVRGPRAWEVARELFKPAGKPLPEKPELHRFWFGTLGNDEVVLAVTAPLPCGRGSWGAARNEPRPQGRGLEVTIEVHCHGGRRVVRWVIEQFLAHGCVEVRTPRPSGEGFELLQRASTLRTASIILDQLSGAFACEVQRILPLLETDPNSALAPIQRLAALGRTVGRHLVEPWKVVVAGLPNVGKSSLVNALAGYQRSVVSELAGTTRDAVSVRVAFDGWPVELIDTAGLREAEGLEATGIERAEEELAGADLVLWVMDGSAAKLDWPGDAIALQRVLVVINKSDAMVGWGPDPNAGDAWGSLLVSALTGAGIGELAAATVSKLVSTSPGPGAAIPFTPGLVELVQQASESASRHEWEGAARSLREALASAK